MMETIQTANDPTPVGYQMGQLDRTARRAVWVELCRQYPQASDRFLRYKLAERVLGQELAKKVLGEVAMDAN